MDNQHKIIVHDYNGHCIYQREKDGYANLTRMGKVYGKQVSDWTRLSTSKAYIREVSTVTGIPREALVIVKQGGDNREPQGTWGHRLVAISFAQWLNESFAVWCNQHLLELVETGVTKLNNEVTNIQDQTGDFGFYLQKLIELKPMLEKDTKLAKQRLKHIYTNL